VVARQFAQAVSIGLAGKQRLDVNDINLLGDLHDAGVDFDALSDKIGGHFFLRAKAMDERIIAAVLDKPWSFYSDIYTVVQGAIDRDLGKTEQVRLLAAREKWFESAG